MTALAPAVPVSAPLAARDHAGLLDLQLRNRTPQQILAAAIRDLFPGRIALVSSFGARSEEHTSELQSLMRISYAVFCLKKKKTRNSKKHHQERTTLNRYKINS